MWGFVYIIAPAWDGYAWKIAVLGPHVQKFFNLSQWRTCSFSVKQQCIVWLERRSTVEEGKIVVYLGVHLDNNS